MFGESGGALWSYELGSVRLLERLRFEGDGVIFIGPDVIGRATATVDPGERRIDLAREANAAYIRNHQQCVPGSVVASRLDLAGDEAVLHCGDESFVFPQVAVPPEWEEASRCSGGASEILPGRTLECRSPERTLSVSLYPSGALRRVESTDLRDPETRFLRLFSANGALLVEERKEKKAGYQRRYHPNGQLGYEAIIGAKGAERVRRFWPDGSLAFDRGESRYPNGEPSRSGGVEFYREGVPAQRCSPVARGSRCLQYLPSGRLLGELWLGPRGKVTGTSGHPLRNAVGERSGGH